MPREEVINLLFDTQVQLELIKLILEQVKTAAPVSDQRVIGDPYAGQPTGMIFRVEIMASP